MIQQVLAFTMSGLASIHEHPQAADPYQVPNTKPPNRPPFFSNCGYRFKIVHIVKTGEAGLPSFDDVGDFE